MNTFLNELKASTNFGYTENGAIKYLSTLNPVLDMFAFGGAYRTRSTSDRILLFKNAYEVDPMLAIKCLFYLRDVRGGMGERKFFREVFHWLSKEGVEVAKRLVPFIAEYGRWDDILYSTVDTPVFEEALKIVKFQLALDMECTTPSLLAKWLPSCNASSRVTKEMGNKVRKYLGMTYKEYRKTLSVLRSRINIVEKLMSENRWDEIEFDKIPSVAGLKYKNAFARRDILAKKYETFAKDNNTTVNADTLYPYDIAHKVFTTNKDNDVDRAMLQKYWDNLPNYYGNNEENGIAIVDTSGSMWGKPIEAAVSLGAYIAEKAHGPFANHFITFSSDPHLVKFEGVDIYDKFQRCKRADWGMSTNLEAVFNLLLETAKSNNTKVEDMPTRLYIFSDMEFNQCLEGCSYWNTSQSVAREKIMSLTENMDLKWREAGYKLPEIIFWNLNARNDNIPALGNKFSYVSGLSPVMIETILGGKSGVELMLEKLNSDRYAALETAFK